LEEELDASGQDVTLVRKGEPLPIVDPELKVIWVVHPFLFDYLGEKFTLDWENSEYRWITFAQLQQFDTVPKLVLTAKRAIEAPRTFPAAIRSEFSQILSDRVHGARYMTEQLLRMILRICSERPNAVSERLLDDIWLELTASQTAIAPLWNILFSLQSQHKRDASRGFASTVQRRTRTHLNHLRTSFAQTVQNGAAAIKEKSIVATLSNSGTVYSILREAHRRARLKSVLVAESRPLSEGLSLAQLLSSEGVRTTVYADTSIPAMASEADLALVGGDAVMYDGAVVNKVGTSILAESCHDERIPFLSAVETIKFDLRTFLRIAPTVDEKSTSRVKIESSEPAGSLFDVTEPQHITALLTEKGSVKPNAVAAMMKDILLNLMERS
jgi:translation initiation factor 2B subunit (eIF-2B alpha/beta/delta family)